MSSQAAIEFKYIAKKTQLMAITTGIGHACVNTLLSSISCRLLLGLKYLLWIHPESLGVGRSHGRSITFTYIAQRRRQLMLRFIEQIPFTVTRHY